MAAFLAAHLFQDIVTAVAASYRARGIFKRLAVTPISPRRAIAAQLTPYLVFGLANTALMLAVGTAVGAHVRLTPNLLQVIPLAGAVVATALCFAYAIAGFAPSPQTANAISSAAALPLIFFTGAAYPLQALPAPLGEILQWAMPYAPLIRAIRGIALEGTGIGAYGFEVLVGAAWLVLASPSPRRLPLRPRIGQDARTALPTARGSAGLLSSRETTSPFPLEPLGPSHAWSHTLAASVRRRHSPPLAGVSPHSGLLCGTLFDSGATEQSTHNAAGPCTWPPSPG